VDFPAGKFRISEVFRKFAFDLLKNAFCMNIKHILIGGWLVVEAGLNTATAQTSESLVKSYRFGEAINALNSEITKLKRRKQDTSQQEQLLEQARKGQRMLEATEKVTIIDSLVVDKAEFLDYYALSSNEGSILTYNEFYNISGTENIGTVFVNERQTVAYISKTTEEGTLGLYQSENINNTWSVPELLQGMGQGETNRNYPYMCSDGITFYYAAEGDNSLGGYDIFVTRYNATEKAFLKSENVGMPFNSPANDYMLAIDETHQLGWFASDRFQPEDKVCIYIFIPTETRDIYTFASNEAETLRQRARINSIADTWEDNEAVTQAKARLLTARTEADKENSGSSSDCFVVDDSRSYTDITQFRSTEARDMYLKLIQQKSDLQKLEKQLDDLRTQYAAAGAGAKEKLKEVILPLEKVYGETYTATRQLEKEIRNKEIQSVK
jgi:hypothetical protein